MGVVRTTCEPDVISLSIADGESTTAAVDIRNRIVGVISVPDSWTAADIGATACNTSGGTFTAVKDEYGAVVKITSINTTTGARYQIPQAIMACHWVKFVSLNTSTGAAANQTGAKALTLELK